MRLPAPRTLTTRQTPMIWSRTMNGRASKRSSGVIGTSMSDDLEQNGEQPTLDAFDQAVADIKSDDAEADVPRRKVGRPRGSKTRRGTKTARGHGGRFARRAMAEERAVSSASIDALPNESAAAVSAPPPGIPPATVAKLLGWIDHTAAERIGTAPLSEQELKEGGEVLAPVVDFYLPRLLTDVRGVAVCWLLITYGPRAADAIEVRKQRRKSAAAAAVQQSTSSTPSPRADGATAATFRRDAATNVDALAIGIVRPSA